MSRWKFWDWVGYAGIAIAAIFIFLDQGIKSAPGLSEKFSVVIGSPIWGYAPFAWVVFGTAILGAHWLGWIGSALEDTAELHLRYFQGNAVPQAVSSQNVWRFYSLLNTLGIVTSSGVVEGHSTNIFIVFDKPVKVGTLVLSSADYVLPRYEVKELNNRFAVISMFETPPQGVLDIKVVNH